MSIWNTVVLRLGMNKTWANAESAHWTGREHSWCVTVTATVDRRIIALPAAGHIRFSARKIRQYFERISRWDNNSACAVASLYTAFDNDCPVVGRQWPWDPDILPRTFILATLIKRIRNRLMTSISVMVSVTVRSKDSIQTADTVIAYDFSTKMSK